MHLLATFLNIAKLHASAGTPVAPLKHFPFTPAVLTGETVRTGGETHARVNVKICQNHREKLSFTRQNQCVPRTTGY